MVNTIELSMCGGDAAFCQITLTTCKYCIPQLLEIMELMPYFLPAE